MDSKNKSTIITTFKGRIILLVGAGIILFGMFLPWFILAGKPSVVGGPYRYEIPFTGYLGYSGLISGAIGLLVILIATARSSLDRLSGVCLIALGAIELYVPRGSFDYIGPNGNIDIFDPSMVPIVLDGIGKNVTYLGALFVIIGGLFIFIAAARTQKQPLIFEIDFRDRPRSIYQ